MNMSNTPLVLVVDDEDTVRNIVATFTRALGYRSLQASDSNEALNLLDQHRPELILLDIVAPGSGSIEILKTVKRNEALSAVSIIVMSHADNLDAVTESMQAGADDFLLKPFNATLFNARVTRALEHNRLRHAMQEMQSSLAGCQMKLQQAGMAREDFCRSLSHDINNLLTGILMTAELMLIKANPEQQQKNIEDIIDLTEHISALIKQRRASLAQDS